MNVTHLVYCIHLFLLPFLCLVKCWTSCNCTFRSLFVSHTLKTEMVLFFQWSENKITKCFPKLFSYVTISKVLWDTRSSKSHKHQNQNHTPPRLITRITHICSIFPKYSCSFLQICILFCRLSLTVVDMNQEKDFGIFDGFSESSRLPSSHTLMNVELLC